ncbi:RICIN domain-containing protein [Streptomyces parvus]|uniref:RICIN domain-containing protein n=1 Tax=Streptomyces parvus TaxID=66428 RepID=UPI0037214104
MPLSRRQLITTAVATAVATGATSRWATTATPDRHRVPAARGGHYSPNAAPLHPTAFLKLPPGKVTAHGWPAGQLKIQLEGLCGRYEEFSHFLDFTATGWVRPERGGWYRIRNRNSDKVLAVDGMSTADSAHVVQYDDNGTADHLWRLLL